MRLSACESPVIIRNKVTGLLQSVPCGKCNACRNIKASTWVQRLEAESQCWPYVVFFTLTYDDVHVPKLTYHVDNDAFYLADLVDGSIVDGSNELLSRSLRDRRYCRKRTNIPYVSVRDCQLFMKRLRYYFTHINRSTHEYDKVRYYMVSEYGPTTFRPHYHGLLFFKSQTAAAQIVSLVSSAWPFGRIDASFVQSTAAAYCAKYVNSTSHLPKIYQLKQLRPFVLCSKCPSLGTMSIANEEVRELFYSASPIRMLPDFKRKQFRAVKHWRCLENSLFPKCFRFSSLSHFERVNLYGIAKFAGVESFSDFKEWTLQQIWKLMPTSSTSCDYNLSYFPPLLHLYNALQLCSTDSPIYHLWAVSNRVLTQAALFGVSLDFYVTQIERYYANKDYLKLSEQMKFLEEYSSNHPLQECINIYSNLSCAPPCHDYYKDFGYSSDFDSRSLELHRYSLANCEDFINYKSLNLSIFRDSLKTKQKNDYLSSHPQYANLY